MLWIVLFLIVLIVGSELADKQHSFFAKQILLMVLILILGLRYDVGRDYPTYEIIYNEPYSIHALAVEPVWRVLNDLLRSVGFQSRMFFFLTALVTMVMYYKGIRKMTTHFYIAIALFVILGFYFEAANTVRQFVAMSILFCGYQEYLDRKVGRFLVYGVIAVLFHTSVLFALPLMLLSRLRFPALLLFGVIIVSFLYGNRLLDIAISRFMPLLAEANSYQYSVEDFDPGIGSGTLKIVYNVLTLLIVSLLVSRKSMKVANSNLLALLNMVVIGVVLYNVFYLFQPARRLYLYFFPFIVVLLPGCYCFFRRDSARLLLLLTFGVFLLFLIKSNIGLVYDFDFNFY